MAAGPACPGPGGTLSITPGASALTPKADRIWNGLGQRSFKGEREPVPASWGPHSAQTRSTAVIIY